MAWWVSWGQVPIMIIYFPIRYVSIEDLPWNLLLASPFPSYTYIGEGNLPSFNRNLAVPSGLFCLPCVTVTKKCAERNKTSRWKDLEVYFRTPFQVKEKHSGRNNQIENCTNYWLQKSYKENSEGSCCRTIIKFLSCEQKEEETRFPTTSWDLWYP